MRKRVVNASLTIVFAVILSFTCVGGSNIGFLSNFGMNVDAENISAGDVNYPEIVDMTDAYQLILSQGSKEVFEGYPVDENFLMWIDANYGDEVVLDIAYEVFQGNHNSEIWYTYTKNSMHVLWLTYCKDLNYSTYQLENVIWGECSDSEVITMDFVGDINFADDWYTMQAASQRTNGIDDCISEEIRQELQSADLTLVNHEFTYGVNNEPIPGKDYVFEANPEHVALLDTFGTDIVSMANNHVFDYSEAGLVDTMQTLTNANMPWIGAGMNLDEAKRIQYYIFNGRKIAIVAASEIERFTQYTRQATESTSGVLKFLNPEAFLDEIREAKQNADYVIAYVHWGVEGNTRNNVPQEELASMFVEAGADVIIGGHPHRLQGISYIDDVPVAYSIGNFWFSTGTLYTTIAQIQIDNSGEIKLRMIPCLQKDLQTTLITEPEEVENFYQYLADNSTKIGITGDGTIYNYQGEVDPDEVNQCIYQSELGYGAYDGLKDLEGRTIDIVGNLQE